jgi:hypothetical protein
VAVGEEELGPVGVSLKWSVTWKLIRVQSSNTPRMKVNVPFTAPPGFWLNPPALGEAAGCVRLALFECHRNFSRRRPARSSPDVDPGAASVLVYGWGDNALAKRLRERTERARALLRPSESARGGAGALARIGGMESEAELAFQQDLPEGETRDVEHEGRAWAPAPQGGGEGLV